MPRKRSRFGAQAGEIQPNPGANKFRPNPARPLVAFFITNLILGGLATWLAVAYGNRLPAQWLPHPVEVIISATPGTPTADIDEAIGRLPRHDIHVQSPAGLVSFLPDNPWLLLAALVMVSFFMSGPFFFLYCVSSWILAKFD